MSKINNNNTTKLKKCCQKYFENIMMFSSSDNIYRSYNIILSQALKSVTSVSKFHLHIALCIVLWGHRHHLKF